MNDKSLCRARFCPVTSRDELLFSVCGQTLWRNIRGGFTASDAEKRRTSFPCHSRDVVLKMWHHQGGVGGVVTPLRHWRTSVWLISANRTCLFFRNRKQTWIKQKCVNTNFLSQILKKTTRSFMCFWVQISQYSLIIICDRPVTKYILGTLDGFLMSLHTLVSDCIHYE